MGTPKWWLPFGFSLKGGKRGTLTPILRVQIVEHEYRMGPVCIAKRLLLRPCRMPALFRTVADTNLIGEFLASLRRFALQKMAENRHAAFAVFASHVPCIS